MQSLFKVLILLIAELYYTNLIPVSAAQSVRMFI